MILCLPALSLARNHYLKVYSLPIARIHPQKRVSGFCRVGIQTPLGETGVVFRFKPFRFIRVLLPGQHWVASPSAPMPGWLREDARISNKRLTRVIESISDYFNGYAVEIPWHLLQMESLTDLQQAVLRATAAIPFGGLRSYGEIAAAIGRPRACRFVGTALAKNPFPIVIPCHRVVRSDASIGQFGGGSAMKQKLLDMEALWRLRRG